MSSQSSIMDPNANTIDVITAIQTLSLFFWSFFLVTFFCLIGEMVTNQFAQFHEGMCHSNWYSYSLEMQRLYLIFIADTQHAPAIAGYGNVLCTRETFKKVKKKIKWFDRDKFLTFSIFLDTFFPDDKYWIFLLHDDTSNARLEKLQATNWQMLQYFIDLLTVCINFFRFILI